MTKFYEVRVTATADIVELWRVEAESDDEAIEAIESGEGEYIRQVDCDNEHDRCDWQADEITADEYRALSGEDGLAAAAPDMLAALETISGKIGSYHDAETDDEQMHIIADIEATVSAAIAKAKGESI